MEHNLGLIQSAINIVTKGFLTDPNIDKFNYLNFVLQAAAARAI